MTNVTTELKRESFIRSSLPYKYPERPTYSADSEGLYTDIYEKPLGSVLGNLIVGKNTCVPGTPDKRCFFLAKRYR